MYSLICFLTPITGPSITDLSKISPQPACISPSLFCHENSKCIAQSQLCDGKPDCPSGADEQFCKHSCPDPGNGWNLSYSWILFFFFLSKCVHVQLIFCFPIRPVSVQGQWEVCLENPSVWRLHSLCWRIRWERLSHLCFTLRPRVGVPD